ncbi:MAG: hypothetical protein ACLUEQ_10600 [Cloacibacillus evryensis]
MYSHIHNHLGGIICPPPSRCWASSRKPCASAASLTASNAAQNELAASSPSSIGGRRDYDGRKIRQPDTP